MIGLRAIQVRYGNVTVLDDVNLNIEARESVAIVGESGAGKSTLARVLLGLTVPSSGSYAFGDDDVSGLRGKRLRAWRERVQAVLQNPTASLNPRLRIDVSVTEPLTAKGRLRRADRRTKAEELLDEVGLDADLAGRFPGQLSGGQRQRVVIARALAADPDLILLDEPVSALDASARAQILNLLADLKAETGVTTVYITHDLATVAYLCERVVVLYDGQVMEDLTMDELLAGPDHPYTQALCRASQSPAGTDEAPDDHGPDPEPVITSAGARSGCPFADQCPYTQEVCRTTRPPLIQVESRGWSRCHFAGQPK